MKVVVDPTLCEANALCVEAAPQVFELDDDVLRIARPVLAPGQEEAARFAVLSCPKQALRIVD